MLAWKQFPPQRCFFSKMSSCGQSRGHRAKHITWSVPNPCCQIVLQLFRALHRGQSHPHTTACSPGKKLLVWVLLHQQGAAELQPGASRTEAEVAQEQPQGRQSLRVSTCGRVSAQTGTQDNSSHPLRVQRPHSEGQIHTVTHRTLKWPRHSECLPWEMQVNWLCSRSPRELTPLSWSRPETPWSLTLFFSIPTSRQTLTWGCSFFTQGHLSVRGQAGQQDGASAASFRRLSRVKWTLTPQVTALVTGLSLVQQQDPPHWRDHWPSSPQSSHPVLRYDPQDPHRGHGAINWCLSQGWVRGAFNKFIFMI